MPAFRKGATSLLLGLALLAAALPAAAQLTESRIVGKATDTSSAVLPGVTVTVSSVQTGAVRTAVTSRSRRSPNRPTPPPSGSVSSPVRSRRVRLPMWRSRFSTAEAEKLPQLAGGARLVAPVKVVPRETSALTAEAKAQVATLAQDGKTQLAKVAAKDDELNAYRQVLIAYLALLNELERSLRNLQVTAEQAQPAIPSTANLERAVILLREAYMAYQDKGKG